MINIEKEWARFGCDINDKERMHEILDAHLLDIARQVYEDESMENLNRLRGAVEMRMKYESKYGVWYA